ncbi:methyltransferase domain-containing protein [Sulfitobacter sp. D35]|uniref:class I SAM-dependent DNA methyltransferase n=1 Tax=Sulfitobacter sp. D35 TaxID=3083252 RepID=UPI00296FA9EB|nr:methyltransferase domain-containing protein [Sulfitobacter sp. D35]MDW4499209.1 methyltransferase domain-containing protein [Sulfitobacter sp. D35]
MPDYDLDNAYAIDGPQDARKLYGAWAQTYDSSFGEGWGFIAPRLIAELYLSESDGNEPILDIGAGTGLVTEHLRGAVVDAFDITPQMLDVARGKGIYRNLIEGDLLAPLDLADSTYGGVISCGTFTHGHVGPACLPELLRVTRSGGLFVCGTIPAVLDGMGFGSALARLQAAGAITPLRFAEIRIYDRKHHDHAEDRGLVMIFRKT